MSSPRGRPVANKGPHSSDNPSGEPPTALGNHSVRLLDSAAVDQIDWSAPLLKVDLWVELPFWLMVDNTSLRVEHKGCTFDVRLLDHYYELFLSAVTDSRSSVLYQGPKKKRGEFDRKTRAVLKQRPKVLWRKCKTVVKIGSRCNASVFDADDDARPWSHRYYLADLCRAHIPVLNRVIQSYRLATYDYFAFEVSPWDVPRWMIEREHESITCNLVPYRGWDWKPPVSGSPYQLINGADLQASLSASETPGELELLDAQNLMERGDYSGAVRRVTTAIEVVLEWALDRQLTASDGQGAAVEFLRKTRTSFQRRLDKYQTSTKRTLSPVLATQLLETRELRHRIVHDGERVEPGERGRAQKAVDMGRWTFNWIENDETRAAIRERRIGLRSLGRDLAAGMFDAEVTPDGVVVSPPEELV